MKKNYEKINEMHRNKIKELKEAERKAIKKYIKKESFSTKYIIIYDTYFLMYTIENGEIKDIIKDKDVNRVNKNVIKMLGYKGY